MEILFKQFTDVNQMMKTCYTCNIEKEIEEFRIQNKKTESRVRHCWDCARRKNREYYKKTREKHLARKKEYYKENRSKIRAKQTTHYYENQDHILSQKKEYYLKNREEIIRKVRERYHSDPHYKMVVCMRRRTREFIQKNAAYHDVLQCSHSFLLRWFEFNFKLDPEWDMNWENFGVCWQIDHVYPLAKTRGLPSKNQCKYFSWRNLRPVKREYNCKKSDKIVQRDLDLIKERVQTFLTEYPEPFDTIYPIELIEGEEFVNDLEEPNEYENAMVHSLLKPHETLVECIYVPPKVEDLPNGNILITNPDGTTLELIDDLENE